MTNKTSGAIAVNSTFPRAIQRPHEKNNESQSAQLMEARLLELIASLRQLIRSNQQLDEVFFQPSNVSDQVDRDDAAAAAAGNYAVSLVNIDNDDNQVFLQAIVENEAVITKQIQECQTLVQKLSRGLIRMDVDESVIPSYGGSLVLRAIRARQQQRQKEQNQIQSFTEKVENDGGIYL